MDELFVVLAVCLLVALAAYVVRDLIGRSSARVEEGDFEEGAAYRKSPHAVWRELDRQRTRRDVRHHWH